MIPRHRTLLLALALTAPSPSPAAAPADVYGDPLPAGALARMGSLRLRHIGDVPCAAFSPDGKTLAALPNSSDSTSDKGRLWDVATGKELRRLPDTDHPFDQLAFSPDGKVLVGVGNSVFIFWDPATGKRIRHPAEDAGLVSAVAFSPDGKVLATGHDGGGKKEYRIRLWDTASGKQLRQLYRQREGVYRLTFSVDGKRLISGSYAPEGPSGPDVEILPPPGARGRGHRPDETPSGPKTGEILLWDTRAWKVLRRLPYPDWPAPFSPDGRTVVLVGDGKPSLWDLEAGKVLCRPDLGQHSHYSSYLFSPDGKLLAAGDGYDRLRLWELPAGKEVPRFRGPRARGRPLAFSRDGRLLATDCRGEVQLWDVRTGREACPVGGHRDPVVCLAFSPDGKTLLSGSEDRTVRAWDARTGKELRRFEGHRAAVTGLALSADGRVAASGDAGGTVILWDAGTGKERRRLSLPGGVVTSLAFAPDGGTLTAATSWGAVGAWDSATGKLLRQLPVRWRTDRLPVALSPDGEMLAYLEPPPRAYAITGVLHFRRLVPGRVLPASRGAEEAHESLVFTPDGKFLAAETYRPASRGRILELKGRLWETSTGREVLAIPLGEPGPLAIAPDGRTLFSGNRLYGHRYILGYVDPECQAWDLPTGKLLGRYTGHLDRVKCLAVSPDSRLLATGSDDGTVLIWDATRPPGGKPRPEIPAPRKLAGPWADLAGSDAARAYQSGWAMAAVPRRTVPFLRRRLRPVPRPDPKEIARLIAALDSDQFAQRRKATQELEKQGEQAEATLKAMLAGRPSLEVRRRVERLLRKFDPPSGEHLRALRAVVVLERIGTPEARKLLEELAGGAPEARLTWEARAALRRLAAKR